MMSKIAELLIGKLHIFIVHSTITAKPLKSAGIPKATGVFLRPTIAAHFGTKTHSTTTSSSPQTKEKKVRSSTQDKRPTTTKQAQDGCN